MALVPGCSGCCSGRRELPLSPLIALLRCGVGMSPPSGAKREEGKKMGLKRRGKMRCGGFLHWGLAIGEVKQKIL